jgi:hypothetical protein
MIRNFVCLAMLGMAMWAQAPVLTGKFILAEEGAASTTLGLLTFDATGAVAGTEYVQASGITQSIPVTGTYAVAADGSGTLTLSTQVVTEDGLAPAVAAVYDFLAVKAGGFLAIRRDSSSATLAEVIPASSATSFAGSFVFGDEGASPSGQSVAEIGLLNLKADGSLSGRVVLKQNGASTTKSVEGSYVTDGSGFGTLKISSPSAADEDGGVVMQTTTYVFLATTKQELITLRADNSLLGLGRIEPAQ